MSCGGCRKSSKGRILRRDDLAARVPPLWCGFCGSIWKVLPKLSKVKGCPELVFVRSRVPPKALPPHHVSKRLVMCSGFFEQSSWGAGRIPVLLSLVCLVIGTVAPCRSLSGQESDPTSPAQRQADAMRARALLQRYCLDCHSGDEPEAQLGLDRYPTDESVTAARDVWQKVIQMVKTREMPPQDMEQPSEAERMSLNRWIQQQLDNLDCSQAKPGRVTLRRLNRVEYNNTIRDLVGVSFRPADDFPSDDVGEGFDNIGDVLSMPPLLVEKYVEAAEKIVTEAFSKQETRERIVICRPSAELSKRDCAERILRAFGGRAFRRPMTDAELARLLELMKRAQAAGMEDVRQLQVALVTILASPHFLFKVEMDPEPDDVHATRRLNGYEIATRLSYFLWSSMPDETLFQLAADGTLTQPQVIEAQAMRMLRDPKAAAFVENFAGQWLQLRSLAKVAPDTQRFPTFDDSLRRAMMRETEMFFAHIVREDRSVLDFLTADFTFVNQRLAEHYGITGVVGEEFRQVSLGERRAGVLTHASILTLTSNPTRTSPVKRGKWILENVLGTPPPPPPAGVEELAEGEGEELLGSLRERLEQHRADPNCATCHNRMDPLGFGLENFDAVGAWRVKDGKFPIDPSGELPGQETFAGPVELMTVLRENKSEDFLRCLTKKMLTYALGRGLVSDDECAIRDVLKRMENNDHRFSALIRGIVTSDPFVLCGVQ